MSNNLFNHLYYNVKMTQKEEKNRELSVKYEKFSQERERKLLDKRASDLTIEELKRLLAKKLIEDKNEY